MPIVVIPQSNAAALIAMRRAQCQRALADYEPKGATVGQMQYYAGCVETIYPSEPMPMWAQYTIGGLMVSAACLTAYAVWMICKMLFDRSR